VLAAVLLVVLGAIVPWPLGLLAATLTAAAVTAASIGAFGRSDPRSVPPEAVVVPSVIAGAGVGAMRLVPAGVAWLPVLGLVALALWATLRLEGRLLGATASPSDQDRLRVLVAVIGTAFVGFAGVAALVPGGLGTVGAGFGPGSELGTEVSGPDPMVTLVVADALVAGLLGYRAAALRYPGLRDRLWSAGTYAVVVAVAAGVARAIDLPRLVGPAVLTLVFYLWDAVHSAAPARRREVRFVWETALLVVLGVVVVAWNLRLEG